MNIQFLTVLRCWPHSLRPFAWLLLLFKLPPQWNEGNVSSLFSVISEHSSLNCASIYSLRLSRQPQSSPSRIFPEKKLTQRIQYHLTPPDTNQSSDNPLSPTQRHIVWVEKKHVKLFSGRLVPAIPSTLDRGVTTYILIFIFFPIHRRFLFLVFLSIPVEFRLCSSTNNLGMLASYGWHYFVCSEVFSPPRYPKDARMPRVVSTLAFLVKCCLLSFGVDDLV